MSRGFAFADNDSMNIILSFLAVTNLSVVMGVNSLFAERARKGLLSVHNVDWYDNDGFSRTLAKYTTNLHTIRAPEDYAVRKQKFRVRKQQMFRCS